MIRLSHRFRLVLALSSIASSGIGPTPVSASRCWPTSRRKIPPCRVEGDTVDFLSMSAPTVQAPRAAMTTPRYYTEPVVTLLSRPSFTMPEHLAVDLIGESTDGCL